MKIVVAIDSLKGSLSSREAGDAICTGLLRAMPEAEVLVKPVADGGEGTTDALVDAFNGQRVGLDVMGPYGNPVHAVYGYLPEKQTAVMEMAAAAGITLSHRREPLEATSYGVGQMIRDAIDRGCREFIIGIGGSVTNDGGIGMLTALGFRFLKQDGIACGGCGGELGKIARVDTSQIIPELKDCRFQIACDVSNPLCGKTGCTYVFGPQKGVTDEIKERLDASMSHYADITADALGIDYRNVPGAGAAGGLGFAFLSYLHGELKPGISLVLEALQLDACICDADLVITGEGCLDSQTAFGKAPAGVAECAKRYGIPVIAFAGSIKNGASICNEKGIDAFFSIIPHPMPLEDAVQRDVARANLEQTAEQVFRLINVMI